MPRRDAKATKLQSFRGCGRQNGATTKAEIYVVPAGKFKPENQPPSFNVTKRTCLTRSERTNTHVVLTYCSVPGVIESLLTFTH